MNIKTIFRSSIILLAISNLGNFFQYLMQIVLGRALSPSDFGIYNTVNSIFVVLTGFSVVISFVTARELIKLRYDTAAHAAFMSDLLIKTAIGAFAISTGMALVSSYIARYFSLDSALPVLICALIMTGFIVQSVFTGIMQGTARYIALSLVQTIQNGIRLLFIVIIVIYLHFSYNGALLGVFLSYLAVILYYLYILRDSIVFPSKITKPPDGIYRSMFQGAVPMALMWGYLGIVSNADIPIVKHFSTGHDAGIYAGGAILGRIAWFLPSMLVFVLFPEVVRNEMERQSSVWSTVVIASITLVISLGIAVLFSLYPEFILKMLLGTKYVAAKDALIVVSFSMAIVAILSVIYNYCLAKHHSFFLYHAYVILLACIILIYGYYHSKPIEVAYVFLAGLTLTLLVNVGQFVYKFKTEIAYHIIKMRQENKSFWSVR